MKNESFKSILTLIIAVAAVLFIASPPEAQAQVSGQFLLWTNVIPAGATNAAYVTNNTTTSTPFRLRGNQGLALSAMYGGAAGGDSNVIFGFDISVDGTNYTTTVPLQFTLAANGTNAVCSYTNVPPAWLNNARYLKLTRISNAMTNAITISNVTYGYFP